MAYILDIAVILILGYKRGFVKAAIKLVGCILAVIVAGAASIPLAAGIFDTFAAAD